MRLTISIWAWSALVLLLPAAIRAADPPVIYDVTDITGWSEVQLATIPYFRHAVFVLPWGGSNLSPRARNHAGQIVGVAASNSDYAAYYESNVLTYKTWLGQYYWSYTTWDGDDLHFYNGYVRFARLYDVNASGTSVGESTVQGSGSSSLGWSSRAISYDPATSESLVVLTPEYFRGTALGINNSGTITGWVADESSPTRGFRRMADGQFELLDGLSISSTKGIAINNAGLIAGESYAASFEPHAVAFMPGTTQPIDLGLPSNGVSDAGTANGMNESGAICGAVWAKAQSYEHFAAVWLPVSEGQWEAWDLNEMLSGGDVLLENARAINDEGLILATGRPDGSDVFGSRTYILTPQGTDWNAPAGAWVVY
ncbi:hypothetical protein KQI84_04220 [bacterium]|nr:hypothetical protein [bacterium]